MSPRFRAVGRLVLIALAAACAAGLCAPASASADLASLKAACVTRDALDGDTSNGNTLPYLFCDDGVPDQGGRTPNETGAKAIEVPQHYDGVAGLPPKIAPDPNAGADSDGNIALDVDVSLPDPARFPVPAKGYPLIVMMHGCCAGNKTSWERSTVEPSDAEGWHYNNAWFASRGYVVLTYTSRGFVSSDSSGNKGSTGETQLDHTAYEINDYQHLAGQLVDDPFFHVNRKRIVTTGGSYGGGFSWLALTDPKWTSPGGRNLRLATSAPKYGWSDLVYSLVPNGTHRRGVLPATDGSDSAEPLGFPKQSIVAGLYASGKTGVPPGTGSHATFPPDIDEGSACLESTDPFDSNPLCDSTIDELLPEFIQFRSAYYQNSFFNGLKNGRIKPVPVYSAGTLTDTLFPSHEHRRMVDRLKKTVDGYPVQEFYGDYQHFTQNKAKEWGDLCGEDRCSFEDYPDGDLNARPDGLVRKQGQGATMRLNRFIDHYAHPPGNPHQPQPRFNVTASLQICPENASDDFPADGPGPRFTAATFAKLAPETLRIDFADTQVTTNDAEPNGHATNSDPIANEQSNDARCPVETSPAGPGVATYDSPELPRRYTLIGATRVAVAHDGTGNGIQLNARLYDLFPNGDAVLVDRGLRVIENDEADGTTVFDLFGAGWRFEEGHRIRIELAQDNAPFIKSSNQPSSLSLTAVTLKLPVRERSARLGPSAAAGPEDQEAASEDVPAAEGVLPDDVELPDGGAPPDAGELPDDGVLPDGEGDGADGGDAPGEGPAAALPAVPAPQ